MVVPVMYDERSEARNAITSATSSGLAGTGQRWRRTDALEPARFVDVGLDQAGADAEHADALLGDLVGQSGGERVDRGLARGVVDVLAG